jgi:hypothetical protein
VVAGRHGRHRCCATEEAGGREREKCPRVFSRSWPSQFCSREDEGRPSDQIWRPAALVASRPAGSGGPEATFPAQAQVVAWARGVRLGWVIFAAERAEPRAAELLGRLLARKKAGLRAKNRRVLKKF